jgi:HK97 family phage major capsid protein
MDEQKIQDLTDKVVKNSKDFQDKVKELGEKKLESSDFKVFEEKNLAEFNKLKDEIALLKTPKINAEELKEQSRGLEMKAFSNVLRGRALSPEEAKVLTIGDPTTGGYLAPVEYVAQIIKGITEFSPVRQLAYVRSTSNHSVQVPARTTVVTAAWTSEQGTHSESTGPAYGLKTMTPHEMYALKDISGQDLEDTAFNMEAELASEFAEAFGVLEGTAFVSGTSVGQPEGILTNPTVAASYMTTSAATSGTFIATDLMDAFYALKSAYAPNSTWGINRSVVGVIRKFTDNTTGQFLWQPGLVAGTPDSLLGRPIVEMTDMASAMAGSAKVAILGDFKRGYTIVDRIQISILRDQYTQAATGRNVRFHAWKRVDGLVTLPEAFRVLRCSA